MRAIAKAALTDPQPADSEQFASCDFPSLVEEEQNACVHMQPKRIAVSEQQTGSVYLSTLLVREGRGKCLNLFSQPRPRVNPKSDGAA